MSKIKAGDEVICIKALGSGNRLWDGQTYTVETISGTGNHLKIEGRSGYWSKSRFKLAKAAKAKPTPFGQVKAVTVNKSDILDVLTQYVRFGLGIDASVEKIIEKFPEAIELVLNSEAAA
ncbi:MAG: hypothetical protein EOR00_09415 [Mesorhizobium sp.]|uniref:hypothetical protein n=1 Tax=Mesorhizobium sp. TaxID=1871066 RepID=UPI000FE782DE|nr:hypothetical protein [Mesorhizobium sp.]RWP18847.1 MAG: hypothetical protein EOR00_09415 [Mesorhizobium sp.]